MVLLIMEFAGLHILHWVISALLPLIMALVTIFCLLLNRRLLRRTTRAIDPLIGQIACSQGRTISHLPEVNSFFQGSGITSIAKAFDKMQQECQELYQGRWLPDPGRWLRPGILLTPLQQGCQSLRPTAGMLAIAILASVASLLVQVQIPSPYPELTLGLILLPLLVGLAGALLTASSAQRVRWVLNNMLQDLQQTLENRLPVFNSQSGLAMLIDNFLTYDRQMNNTLQEFTATAGRLAESDMADGIRRSVEQVLQESVAPSIRQSSTVLANLAGELTNRQERGMQDLAAQFAAALSAELTAHLQPVNREIAQMGTLMADVKNYIEYAMRALDTVRQQSEGQLGDTRQTLQQLAESRARMTADLDTLAGQMQSLTQSAGQMAELYQGNEQNLKNNLQQLSHQLDQYSQRQGSLTHEAIQAMQNARLTAEDQQASAGQYVVAMQDQVGELTGNLSTVIQDLLSQVRQETASIAGHASSIGQQLGALNTTLDRSMNDFTATSAQYVRQTLTNFDTGLAELAGRLAQTADLIRDAVDALPAALQQSQVQPARPGE